MAKGEGRYYPKKAAAIAAAKSLQAEGVRNIDVDCMQINLMHHKKAFPSIEAAFDPAINVAYGGEVPCGAASENKFLVYRCKALSLRTSQVPPPLSRTGLPDLAKHQNQTPGTARASSDKRVRVDEPQQIDLGRDRSVRQPPGEFRIK